jgi:indole-3-glycerol phosphate synthase
MEVNRRNPQRTAGPPFSINFEEINKDQREETAKKDFAAVLRGVIHSAILNKLTDAQYFDSVDNFSFMKFMRNKKVRGHVINDIVRKNPSKNEARQRTDLEYIMTNCEKNQFFEF